MPVIVTKRYLNPIVTLMEVDCPPIARKARPGQFVMVRLHELDEVAYIRFASVYRRFTDVNQFLSAITEMVKK